jgi:hypothetical protein
MAQDDPNLGDLTRQMAGWVKADPTQLHLDDARVNAFLERLKGINGELQAQLADADKLHAWLGGANVGTFESATTTRSNLQQDVLEFITAIQQFHDYLNAVSASTDAARRNIQTLDRH